MSTTIQQDNEQIADRLDEVALLLEQQQANVFRVQAYRRAAQAIRGLPEPVAEILQRAGLEGLDRLPGIGAVIARAIRELVVTGHLAMLERLRGESDPVAMLASVAGIGPTLARRLHDEYDIETLEQLEAAAHDGRLAEIEGFGEKRVANIRDALAARLGRLRRPPDVARDTAPPVSELLDVDREYADAVTRGSLRRIAPRRFNARGEAWLPVLHTHRGDRHYTVLFSNTAMAHRLGRTRDWVVMYWDGATGEHQSTVVTARTGALSGRRVVRGREAECRRHYQMDEPEWESDATEARTGRGR